MNGLKLTYSCDGCGLKNADVMVRYREPDEDIVHWIDTVVGMAISADHQAKSPLCPSRTMRELKIPMPHGDNGIGMLTLN